MASLDRSFRAGRSACKAWNDLWSDWYDYMDVFEARDHAEAAEVVLITGTIGHAATETWSGLPYEKFVKVVKDATKE